MGQTLEILIVVKINGNPFTKLLVMVLPFVIRTLRIFLQKNYLLYHPLRYCQFYSEQLIHIVQIYLPPGRIRTFIADMIEALYSLPVRHQTVMLGDFNNWGVSQLHYYRALVLFNSQNSKHMYMGEYYTWYLTMTHLLIQHYGFQHLFQTVF